uniref:Integrator complex subunit 4/Protein SIEL C-terminal Ig-like domain-containing protein n=1 Tax=Percolomonas cosmopolitus TaxID=63605 RepID=A0A7S1PHF7_9EUKA
MKRKHDFTSASPSSSPKHKKVKLSQSVAHQPESGSSTLTQQTGGFASHSPHRNARGNDRIQHNYGNQQSEQHGQQQHDHDAPDSTTNSSAIQKSASTHQSPSHHQQNARICAFPEPFQTFQSLSQDHICQLQKIFNAQMASTTEHISLQHPKYQGEMKHQSANNWTDEQSITYLTGMNSLVLTDAGREKFPKDPAHVIHFSWLCSSSDPLLRKHYLTYLYNCGCFDSSEHSTGIKIDCLEMLRGLSSDEDSRVRVEALRILSKLLQEIRGRYRIAQQTSAETRSLRGKESPHTSVTFGHSPSNIHILLTFKQQKQLLRISSKMMDDPYPYVRIRAIELLAELSHMNNAHLEHGTAGGTSEFAKNGSAPFTDKIFCMLCEKIRDTEVSVRARATELLGSLRNIKSDLLFDTFDKMKLEYRNRYSKRGKKKGGGRRGKKRQSSGVKHVKSDQTAVNTHLEVGHRTEVGLGKTDLNIASMTDEESIQESLFQDPALGAFVLALEDEYQVVRMAAISSICQLSFTTEQFSKLSIDFVLEMFNDDIDSVRVFAIQTLSKIGTFIRFNEEQLHIALTLLEDASIEIRQSVREFISLVRLASATCLQAAFYALSACLKRNPQDEHAIFVSLKCLGQNHPHLTSLVVEDLLQLDRVILKPRKHVEDPYYVAAMILVCNGVRGGNGKHSSASAAGSVATASEMSESNYFVQGNPSLFSLLPNYVYDQYLEMKKGKHGDLFPLIPARRISPSLIPTVRESGVPGRLTYILDEPSVAQAENSSSSKLIAEQLMEAEDSSRAIIPPFIASYIRDQFACEWHKEFTSQANHSVPSSFAYHHLLDSISTCLKKRLQSHVSVATYREGEKDKVFFQIQFLRQFAKCTQLFVRLFTHRNMSSRQFGSLSTTFRQHARLCSKCCGLIYETYITQNRYLNLPKIIILQLKMMRFAALLCSIMSSMDVFQQQQSIEALESLRDLVRRRISSLYDEITTEKMEFDVENQPGRGVGLQMQTLLQNLRKMDTSLEQNQQAKSATTYLREVYSLVISQFFPLLSEEMFQLPASSDSFQYTYVRITSPESQTEVAREYLCYIPMKIKVKAQSLHAIPVKEISEKFRIVVELPDSTEQWFQFQPDEEHMEGDILSGSSSEDDKHLHLRSNVNVDMSRWRNASTIRLRAVMLYDTDFPDEYRVVLGHHMMLTWTDLQSGQSAEDEDIAAYREHFLPLSKKATHLLVHPHV